MQPGSLLKYANPASAEEAALRFVVIEDRDTRVLVGVVLSEAEQKRFPHGLQQCFAKSEYVPA